MSTATGDLSNPGRRAREWDRPNQGSGRNVWMTISMVGMMFATAAGAYLYLTEQVWGPVVHVFGRDVQLHWTAIIIIAAMISMVQAIGTKTGGTMSIMAVTGLMIISILAYIALTGWTQQIGPTPPDAKIVNYQSYYTLIGVTIFVIAMVARVFFSWWMTDRPYAKVEANTHLVADDAKLRNLRVAGRKTAAHVSRVKPAFGWTRHLVIALKWTTYFATQFALSVLQLGPWNFVSSPESREDRRAANRTKDPLGARLLTGKKNTRKGLAIDLTPGLVGLAIILIIRPLLFQQSVSASPDMRLTYGIWIYGAVTMAMFINNWRKYPKARPFYGR